MPNTSPLKIRLARTQITELGKDSRNGESSIYVTNKPVDSAKISSVLSRKFGLGWGGLVGEAAW